MNPCKRYRVSGPRRYRDADPGCTFEARLDPDAERRALERGVIEVLEVIDPSVPNGEYELPDDWPRTRAADAQTSRAVHGGSRASEGG